MSKKVVVTTISSTYFIRNLKKVREGIDRGEEFIVTTRGVPSCRITP